MDNDLVYNRVEQSPRFRELIDKRSRFAWQLTIVMLAIYFAFILVVAFAPGVLGASVAGGVVTWGIPVGIAVIVAAVRRGDAVSAEDHTDAQGRGQQADPPDETTG